MLYLLAVGLGLAAGMISGGKLSGFYHVKFRKYGFVMMAFAIQALTQTLALQGAKVFRHSAFAIVIISYLLLLTGFWLNRKYSGFLVMGVGSILNAIVMLANSGRMPVSVPLLERAGEFEAIAFLQSGMDYRHVAMNESTHLVFLADIIHLPGILGNAMRVVSIGDIVIAVGIGMIVFEIVKNGRMKNT